MDYRVVMAVREAWVGIYASVRGASHERSGLPNQDATTQILTPDGRLLGLAVADGHGSRRSFRSNEGSQLAVQVAAHAACSLAAGQFGPTSQTEWPHTSHIFATEVVRRWRDSVGRHYAEHPVVEAEYSGLAKPPSEEDILAASTRPATAYGTTLLVAVVVGDTLLLSQVGDGDIVVVSGSGQVLEPVSTDVRNFGNTTTSLSMAGAADAFRFAWLDLGAEDVNAVLLSTDGWRNSFADDDGFLQVGPDVLNDLHANGVSGIRQEMPEWLRHATSEGSGDDVTLAMLVRSDLQGETGSDGSLARPNSSMNARVRASLGSRLVSLRSLIAEKLGTVGSTSEELPASESDDSRRPQ